MVVDERIAAEPIPARRDSAPEHTGMDVGEPPVTIIRPSHGLVALHYRDES